MPRYAPPGGEAKRTAAKSMWDPLPQGRGRSGVADQAPVPHVALLGHARPTAAVFARCVLHAIVVAITVALRIACSVRLAPVPAFGAASFCLR